MSSPNRKKATRKDTFDEQVCVRLSKSTIAWLNSLQPFHGDSTSACIRSALQYAEKFMREFGIEQWHDKGVFAVRPVRHSIHAIDLTMTVQAHYLNLLTEDADHLDDLIGRLSHGISRMRKELEKKRASPQTGIHDSRVEHEGLEVYIVRNASKMHSDERVRSHLLHMMYDEDRNLRVLQSIMLRDILLNSDSFRMEQSLFNQAIVDFELDIVKASKEGGRRAAPEKQERINRLRFVIESARERDIDVSPDEWLLIEELRKRLKLTRRELRILEAQLGFFPKEKNEIHSLSEITDCRNRLQSAGLLQSATVPDEPLFDAIPDEVAGSLRRIWKIDLHSHGYDELLRDERIRTPEYMKAVLSKMGVTYDSEGTIEQLEFLVKEHVRPTELLGGFSNNDGLDRSVLRNWCEDLGLSSSGQKVDLISRIVQHFDEVKQAGP